MENTVKNIRKYATEEDIKVHTYKGNAVADLYDTKMIVSGKRIEVRRYKRPMLKKYFNTSKPERRPIEERKENYTRRSDNRSRARSKLIRLVHANIPLVPHKTLKPKFYLLTYSNQNRGAFENHKQHMQDLKMFIRRVRERYPHVKVEYVGAKEATENKQAHFHILFTGLPFIEKDVLENQLWRQGFVKIKDVKYGYNGVKHLANYVSKYITKQSEELQMYQNQYFVSENLQQPKTTIHAPSIEATLKKASQNNYIITKNPTPYSLDFINNEVTFETWEPL